MAAPPTTPPTTVPRVSIPVGQIFAALDPKLVAAVVVLWLLSVVTKPKKQKRTASRRTERAFTTSTSPSKGTRRQARRPKTSGGSRSTTPAVITATGAQSPWAAPPTIAPDDLAEQAPGATLRAASRGDPASPWAVGADGEEITAQRLADLGDGWRVVHSVPVGKRGSDIDHLVIGPPGVFVLNSKMRPGADVKVIDNGIRVAGVWEPYLHASRHEAERVRTTLAKRRFDVPVTPAIVLIGIKSLSVGEVRPDVAVLAVNDIVWWLRGQPAVIEPDHVEALYQVARQRSTWQ